MSVEKYRVRPKYGTVVTRGIIPTHRCLQKVADADKTLVSSSSSKVDVERLFTDKKVQSLLSQLTGMELENKVFKTRRTSVQARSHYALMTEDRFEKTMERMREEARNFLSLVPLKEPRPNSVRVLSKDEEIAGFDQSKFVFTDITFDATDQDRVVVVREVDGTLRTATPEEHDRMNRVYYAKPNRPVTEPPLFSGAHLQNALDRDEHEFVLDWACWFFEPDDPAFVELSRKVFDAVLESGKFESLFSTRHFPTFCFYLALNGKIPPLLNHFGGQGRIPEAANMIRLQKILHPNWRVAVSSSDTDTKICQDFIRQNERLRPVLTDLIKFMKTGKKREVEAEEKRMEGRTDSRKKAATQTAASISGMSGPLQEMSQEYTVKVAMANEGEGDKRTWKEKGKGVRGRRYDRRTPEKE